MNKIRKEDIVKDLRDLLRNRVIESQKQLADIKIARNSDSKSTAGDKHETGRAMAQLEVDRAMEQLSKVTDQLASFNQIDFTNTRETVCVGSFIEANNFNFLLGIGLGKIETQGIPVISISAASPVGQQLIGKKSGDHFTMGEESLSIAKIT